MKHTNDLLIASYEQARNDERLARWYALGGPRLRQAEIERIRQAERLAYLERMERIARATP